MSRTIAGVFAFTLGFPVLAMIALSASGAFSPDFLSTFLVAGVVVTFVVLALFEIRRLIENDSHWAGHSQDAITVESSGPRTYDAIPASHPVISEVVGGTAEIRVYEAPPTTVEVRNSTDAEAIVVEPSPVAEVPVIVVERESAASDATHAVAIDDPIRAAPLLEESEPSGTRANEAARPSVPNEAIPMASKGKRKGARSKRPTKQ